MRFETADQILGHLFVRVFLGPARRVKALDELDYSLPAHIGHSRLKAADKTDRGQGGCRTGARIPAAMAPARR